MKRLQTGDLRLKDAAAGSIPNPEVCDVNAAE